MPQVPVQYSWLAGECLCMVGGGFPSSNPAFSGRLPGYAAGFFFFFFFVFPRPGVRKSDAWKPWWTLGGGGLSGLLMILEPNYGAQSFGHHEESAAGAEAVVLVLPSFCGLEQR